jgi:hypothetical protein
MVAINQIFPFGKDKICPFQLGANVVKLYGGQLNL